MQLLETRHKDDEFIEHIDMGTSDDFRAILFNEYVKDNPLYDPDEAARSYIKLQSARHQNVIKIQQHRQEQKDSKPHCPNCNSTNISKIGTVERGVSVAAFGLFSGKLGKTMKCNKCGYKW